MLESEEERCSNRGVNEPLGAFHKPPCGWGVGLVSHNDEKCRKRQKMGHIGGGGRKSPNVGQTKIFTAPEVGNIFLSNKTYLYLLLKYFGKKLSLPQIDFDKPNNINAELTER